MKRLNLLVLIIIFTSISIFAQQGGKSIRITGIDPRFTDFWSLRLANSTSYNDSSTGVGFSPYSNLTINNANSFTNGTLTGLLFTDSGNASAGQWNDSGDFYVVVLLTDWEDYGYYVYISKNKVSFRNNITEIAFSDFNFIERLQGQ